MKTLLLILAGLLILSPMFVVNFLPAFKQADYSGKKKILSLCAIPAGLGVVLGVVAIKFLH